MQDVCLYVSMSFNIDIESQNSYDGVFSSRSWHDSICIYVMGREP